jgi:hypothetical protein
MVATFSPYAADRVRGEGIPGHRRECIEAAVFVDGRHASGTQDPWTAADPFWSGFKVRPSKLNSHANYTGRVRATESVRRALATVVSAMGSAFPRFLRIQSPRISMR